MTDKEIIIDDVNVAGCAMLYHAQFCRVGDFCSPCDINPICYFKQLQRKTRECEKINLINERLVKEKYDLNLQIDKLHQECEELKKKLQYAAEENKFQFILREENDRYKQALEKIEETVKKEIVCDNCNLQGTNKCDSRLCTSFYLDDFCKQLLPIINEVKDDRTSP